MHFSLGKTKFEIRKKFHKLTREPAQYQIFPYKKSIKTPKYLYLLLGLVSIGIARAETVIDWGTYKAGLVNGQNGWVGDDNWAITKADSDANVLENSHTEEGTVRLDLSLDGFNPAASILTLKTSIAFLGVPLDGDNGWSDNMRFEVVQIRGGNVISRLFWFGVNARGLFRQSATFAVKAVPSSSLDVSLTADFSEKTYSIEFDGENYGPGKIEASFQDGDKLALRLVSSDGSEGRADLTACAFGNISIQVASKP